jgi:PhnB protein
MVRDVYNPRRGYPSVVPYVRYRDPNGAIRWLSAVVGAREAVRMTLPDGRVGHAELLLGDHVITLGLAVAEGEMDRPADRNAVRAMTLVFVPDVDASTERAAELGGTVVDDATDMPWGLRQSIVADPEGHVWELSTHQHDVPAHTWGAEQTGPWLNE